MRAETLNRATRLLAATLVAHSQALPFADRPAVTDPLVSAWLTAVMLAASRQPLRDAFRSLPENSLLSHPETCAVISVETVAAALEDSDLSPRAARVIQELARWWQTHVNTTDFDSEDSVRLPEQAIQRLHEIRGLSRERGERIRLFALKDRVAVVSRSTQRVFCRHGWLDSETQYDEWQTTIFGWSESSGVPLEQITLWLDELGNHWCGPKPKCDGCPLRPLLPSYGPIDPGIE